jgi:hypothetical protein
MSTLGNTFTDTVLNSNEIKGGALFIKAEFFEKITMDIETLAEIQGKIESRRSSAIHGDFELSAAYLINSIADEHHCPILVSDTSIPTSLRDDCRKPVDVNQTTQLLPSG